MYWMNKISLYNNLFFTNMYYKENVIKSIDMNNLFLNKMNIYKCSICCMLYHCSNMDRNNFFIKNEDKMRKKNEKE